ncbi:hypothetical protein Pcinc_024891 [Petrolisthes cinctipes]|uniref:Uncharacterized protein n=1 Tax=Petrolisthes cinctipes TaxID=88211 RepID=A0AAE1KDU1_PETCI|nr:hypothetical protein Pcinc_024891 [Petrolisthes cinctipes]
MSGESIREFGHEESGESTEEFGHRESEESNGESKESNGEIGHRESKESPEEDTLHTNTSPRMKGWLSKCPQIPAGPKYRKSPPLLVRLSRICPRDERNPNEKTSHESDDRDSGSVNSGDQNQQWKAYSHQHSTHRNNLDRSDRESGIASEYLYSGNVKPVIKSNGVDEERKEDDIILESLGRGNVYRESDKYKVPRTARGGESYLHNQC